jgi:hypothetical protein
MPQEDSTPEQMRMTTVTATIAPIIGDVIGKFHWDCHIMPLA